MDHADLVPISRGHVERLVRLVSKRQLVPGVKEAPKLLVPAVVRGLVGHRVQVPQCPPKLLRRHHQTFDKDTRSLQVEKLRNSSREPAK